jgi:hypothetical protein
MFGPGVWTWCSGGCLHGAENRGGVGTRLFLGMTSMRCLEERLREDLSFTLSRVFSLLLCTGKRREVRLFLRKSHVGSGCSVCTRSENALAEGLKPESDPQPATSAHARKAKNSAGTHHLPTTTGYRRNCLRRLETTTQPQTVHSGNPNDS